MDSRACFTMLKMLRRRGYVVPDAELSQNTVNEVYRHASKPRTLMVYLRLNEARVGVGTVRTMAANAHKVSASDILLVCPGLTHSAEAELEELRRDGITISIFKPSQLLYDIWEHREQPAHRILEPEEVEALPHELHRLPCMVCTDAMCRYLGARIGDVVEITRITPTVGKNIVYRRVVPNAEL